MPCLEPLVDSCLWWLPQGSAVLASSTCTGGYIDVPRDQSEEGREDSPSGRSVGELLREDGIVLKRLRKSQGDGPDVVGAGMMDRDHPLFASLMAV